MKYQLYTQHLQPKGKRESIPELIKCDPSAWVKSGLRIIFSKANIGLHMWSQVAHSKGSGRLLQLTQVESLGVLAQMRGFFLY